MCGHCDQLLCEKALKENRRLYFDNGEWIRMEGCDKVLSRASSPLCVSVPGSDDLEVGSGDLSHDSNQLYEEISSGDEFTFSPDEDCQGILSMFCVCMFIRSASLYELFLSCRQFGVLG